MRPLWQWLMQNARGLLLASGDQLVAARCDVKAIVQQRSIGYAHGLRKQGERARIACEDAISGYAMATLFHTLAHADEQTLGLIKRDDEQQDEKAAVLCISDQAELGFMRKNSFAHKALAF